MKKLLIAVFAVLSIAGQSAHAERDFASIYRECGLGAMLFPNDDVIAIITNVTWDLGTTAILSDASSEDTCKGRATSTASLILETYPMIEKDLAAGQGEYLNAMLETAGCSVASHSGITAGLRSELAASAMDAGYDMQSRVQKSESLFNAVNTVIDRDFAGQCSII